MTDTFYILIRLVVMWAYTFINTQTGHLDICNSLHVKFPSIKRCDYLKKKNKKINKNASKLLQANKTHEPKITARAQSMLFQRTASKKEF